MKNLFEKMNEEYTNQHHPSGSLFTTIHKEHTKGAMFTYIFLGIFLIPLVLITLLFLEYAVQNPATFMDDMIPALLFGGVTTLCIYALYKTKKRTGIGAKGWLMKCAELSKYKEYDIREFDRQVFASDAYIIDLVGKAKSLVNGQKYGFLTRDFIYFSDTIHHNNHKVMKLEDITYACFVERVYYVRVNNVSKQVHSLSLTLKSTLDTTIIVETTREKGESFLTLLQERNPQIETQDFHVFTENEFEQFYKQSNETYDSEVHPIR